MFSEATMYVGADIIGIVQNNTKGLCKDNIDHATSYFTGVCYLVLKRKAMVPG